ncbi:hypothetical protein [Streptomyces tibetensis]|uniref:hypothetical protein n=1 Tax=Streptomyces tibetensis TaxID=2382123 RepID=UPI0033DE0AC1
MRNWYSANALQHEAGEELVPWCNVAKLVQVQTPRYRVGRGLSDADFCPIRDRLGLDVRFR